MPLTLAEIHNEWNTTVPLAQAQGIRVEPWAVPPHNLDYGMYRLNWLRQQLGLVPYPDGPNLERGNLSHRQIQAQWNALVPEAQARGIRAEFWTRPAPSRVRGMRRLNALREQLGNTSATIVGGTVAVTAGGPAIIPVATLPADLSRYTFGVELEALMPQGASRESLSRFLAGRNIRSRLANYSDKTNQPGVWKLKQDGSLADYTRGVEAVSPIFSGEADLEQTAKTANALTEFGCSISRSCGLHVHVGSVGQTADFYRNLIRGYYRYESAIDSVLSPSRRADTNQYCGRNTYDRHSLQAADTGDVARRILARCGRRVKLNFENSNTVEFRQHHGTVDPVKVVNWTKFCLRMVDSAKSNPGPLESEEPTLEGLLAAIKASDEEREYFLKRRADFAVAAQRQHPAPAGSRTTTYYAQNQVE